MDLNSIFKHKKKIYVMNSIHCVFQQSNKCVEETHLKPRHDATILIQTKNHCATPSAPC